jgi:hypothetical protein
LSYPNATQVGSAFWLALAGGHHRVTAVISKAKVVGGQSSVVFSKHHRGARKNSMSAKLLRVWLGVGIGRLHTAIAARNAARYLSQ